MTIQVQEFQKWSIFILPILLSLFFLIYKIVFPENYYQAIQEDSIIEYAQAALYFAAAVLSLSIAFRFFRDHANIHAALYCIFFLFLLVVSLEEISWGQRIFGIDTPGFFFRHNLQHEFTVHNMENIQPFLPSVFICIGFYGSFSWLLQIKHQFKSPFIDFYIPGWYLSFYFFATLCIYFFFDFVNPYAVFVLGIERFRIEHFFLWRDQEPAELLLALGFFFFVLINFIRQRIQVFHFQSSSK